MLIRLFGFWNDDMKFWIEYIPQLWSYLNPTEFSVEQTKQINKNK